MLIEKRVHFVLGELADEIAAGEPSTVCARGCMDDTGKKRAQRLAPHIAANSVLLGDRHTRLYEAIARSLRKSGQFTDIDLLTFAHEVEYSTAAWLDLASTHSDHLTLPAEENAALVGELGAVLDAAGGLLPVRYETTLVTGRTPPG